MLSPLVGPEAGEDALSDTLGSMGSFIWLACTRLTISPPTRVMFGIGAIAVNLTRAFDNGGGMPVDGGVSSSSSQSLIGAALTTICPTLRRKETRIGSRECGPVPLWSRIV